MNNETGPSPATQQLLKILENNWQAEMRGHHTYNTLAQREQDPDRKNALQGMANSERHHAELWAERIRALGGPAPVYQGKESGDVNSFVNRLGGLNATLRRLELDESRDIARYGKQLKEIGDEASIAILHKVLADEVEHYQTLNDLVQDHLPRHRISPDQARQELDELVAVRQKGQPKATGWIGDAIYGVNDGLGAIFGIVSGVSGATVGNSKYVLIAGLAGMIASALSMGSGAYLAAKSEREIFEAEMARERDAVKYNEAEAHEVLVLSYQARGVPRRNAERFVGHLAKDQEQFVRLLVQERLNTTEEALPDPWVSAGSGSLSTAIGAFIPVLPFFFMGGYPAIILAAIISLLAHFAVGAAKSLITIRSWWASGLEMTAVGALEGVVTFVLGLALGKI
jgi:VIT1/CCC1 family predicted Fe2+/Mn2+ transporter/bacterioferritin (cytochrome b1)